jgi:uncharacterized protein with HEPN domain
MKDDRVYLAQILDAAEKIRESGQGCASSYSCTAFVSGSRSRAIVSQAICGPPLGFYARSQ